MHKDKGLEMSDGKSAHSHVLREDGGGGAHPAKIQDTRWAEARRHLEEAYTSAPLSSYYNVLLSYGTCLYFLVEQLLARSSERRASTRPTNLFKMTWTTVAVMPQQSTKDQRGGGGVMAMAPFARMELGRTG